MSDKKPNLRVKQNFVQGASILMGSMIICKILGFGFRLPAQWLLGGLGSGYFTAAYMIFTPFFSLSASGLTSAIARMVAEQIECKRWNDVRRLKLVSKRVFWIVGIISFSIIVSLAWFFVNYNIHNPKALWSVYAIAPAALFGIASASYRGYYEGACNMTPTAISQIVENIVKIIVGFGFMYSIYYIGYAQVKAGVSFLGITTTIKEEFNIQITPYAIAGSLIGVSVSSLGGLVYLWLFDKIKGDGITRRELANSPPPMRYRTLVVRLVKIAIPVSIGSLVINFTSLIDSVTVIDRVFNCIINTPTQLLDSFNNKLTLGTGENAAQNLATTIYGLYTAMALTISVLIPDLVSLLGKSSLPNVAAAWLARSRKRIKYNIEGLIRITSLLAIPAGIGMSVLAHPILTLIFVRNPDNIESINQVEIAAPMLSMLAIVAILISITTPLFSVFQAIGKADLPIKFMLIGAAVKLTTNYLLVSNPDINIKGAPIGTLLCYILIIILCFYYIPKITKIKIGYVSTIAKPLISGLICGLCAWLSYKFIPGSMLIKVGISIIAGAISYVIMLILLRAIKKDDVNSLPNGKKIAKILEKFNVIG